MKTDSIEVRRIAKPLTVLQRSADRMQEATGPAAADAPKTVQLASPGIFARVSLQTVAAIPIAFTVVYLTYFLLANGPLFRRKLAGLRDSRPPSPFIGLDTPGGACPPDASHFSGRGGTGTHPPCVRASFRQPSNPVRFLSALAS